MHGPPHFLDLAYMAGMIWAGALAGALAAAPDTTAPSHSLRDGECPEWSSMRGNHCLCDAGSRCVGGVTPEGLAVPCSTGHRVASAVESNDSRRRPTIGDTVHGFKLVTCPQCTCTRPPNVRFSGHGSHNASSTRSLCKSVLMRPRVGPVSGYVVYYPRAGLGNKLLGLVSATMYACATGRALRIAPSRKIWPTHGREPFECSEEFSGEWCDLEMDTETRDRYIRSRHVVFNPEGWTPQMCKENRLGLVKMLCDDGLDNSEFVSISSCQYYGDLLLENPHFRHLFQPNPFKQLVRAKLTPSIKVAARIKKGPHPLCVHVRHGMDKTSRMLGKPWLQVLQSLGKCVRSLTAAMAPAPAPPVLLFTMDAGVRAAVLAHLEGFQVTFASVTKADSKLGNSMDSTAATADMFTMAHECTTLLVTSELSTYVRLAGVLGHPLIYPQRVWGQDCATATPLETAEPTGDFWVPEDHCNLRGLKCPAQ